MIRHYKIFVRKSNTSNSSIKESISQKASDTIDVYFKIKF